MWLVHPMGRALLPAAVRAGVSANLVSVTGLVIGAGAAIAFARWQTPGMALIGLTLGVMWLVCDGLDGMIARATGTASAVGRILDGICDHGVFVMIYAALAWSIGTPQAWVLATVAGIAHAVQSSLFEGERARFHRRVRGDAAPVHHDTLGNPLVRLYDSVAGSIDRLAGRFDEIMARAPDRIAIGRAYGEAAAPAMRLMSTLSANMRLILITIACAVGAPSLFWWAEIVLLGGVAVVTIAWHRRIEGQLADRLAGAGRLSAGA